MYPFFRVVRKSAGRSVAVLILMGLGLSPAHAQDCGDVITADTVLTHDIGPCPGNGLVIIPREGVVLDLNGFSITGNGSGLGVALVFGGTVVRGPGTIANFGAGIAPLTRMIRLVTISDVTLQDNVVGVALSRNSDGLIVNTTIDGGSVGTNGVVLSENVRMKVKLTAIRHQRASGIRVSNSSRVTLIQNDICENGDGILGLGTAFGLTMTILFNRITNNTGDGIRLDRPFAGPILIQGNDLSSNGRSGLNATSSRPLPTGPITIEDNTAFNNALYGIEVGGGTAQVIDNIALYNGTDLFWDGIGSDSCWRRNTFGTSSPDTLPACP